MPHEFLQEFVVVDYSQKMPIVAVMERGKKQQIIGLGQYTIIENTHTADLALVVGDDYQNKGVGRELLSYLTYLAKKQGLLGFTAEVLVDNKPMLHLFDLFAKMGFDVQKRMEAGVVELKIAFRGA